MSPMTMRQTSMRGVGVTHCQGRLAAPEPGRDQAEIEHHGRRRLAGRHLADLDMAKA